MLHTEALVGDTDCVKTQRAKRRTRTQTWEWRATLVERLEAMHVLILDADAFQSAFEAIYGETSWPTDGDPERRRALNRMSCFVSQLTAVLDALLKESREIVSLAVKGSEVRRANRNE